MKSLTRNILDFYKSNPQNDWYLEKYFTNTNNLGIYQPYAENVVCSSPDGSPFIGTVDEHNTYKINSFGLRGEVYENADVLASGCSITFGLGVPEEARWTNLLGNMINKNVMNLGNPGASAETICNSIIQYCMNNKMPKEIFCLMPDFFRNIVIVDKEFYKSEVKRKGVGESDGLGFTFCNPVVMLYDDGLFMEITNKKYIENYTSPHQLILDSINYIYILETFCFINNIKLYWTSWSLTSTLIMEKLINLENFKLKNYSPFMIPSRADGLSINNYIEKLCHLSHDSEFKDHVAWKEGTDYSIINYKKTSETAHPGIHAQYHFAKFFYELSNN